MRTQGVNPRQDLSNFMESLDKWSFYILANLLWVVLSIPLITLPAATVGLFAVMSQRVQGKQPELFQVFFAAMRDYGLKATLIGCANMMIGMLLLLNLSIFPVMDATDPLMILSRSMTAFLIVLLLLANLYLWPLLVLLALPPYRLLQLSLKFVFLYPGWSLLVLVAAVLPLALSLVLTNALLLTGTFSASAYIITSGTWRVLRRHLIEGELRFGR